MNNKENSIFIEDILENIADINSFMRGVSKDELESNKEKLNAVVRSLEIIGEAAKNLPKSFRDQHSKIPWKKIIGTRDLLIHRYFGIDVDILWEIIKKDLSDLKKHILKIRENLDKN